MKKIFLIVAVLMLATPALAVDVDVWAEQGDDANKVEIWYSVDPVPADCEDGNKPRAFGLNITVTDGNIIDINVPFEGECDDVNRGYGIFPGTITISDGSPGPWGTPVAPDDAPGAEDTGLDTNTIVVEMGSLYEDDNCPDPCALLFTITVNLDCSVCITGNTARAGPDGVVLENLGEVAVDFGDCLVVDQVSRFVPDVVGTPLADANDAIEAEDLVVGSITWVCGNLIAEAGSVTMTEPEALTEVEQGTEVHLWVSRGDCDFGDADDPPYPTLLASNGAGHVTTGVILGVNRDAELDGQPSPNADLDDNTGVPDDEDGITNLLITPVGGTVTVTVTADCNLNAWIDFNDNGDWDDPGEQIFTDKSLLLAGSPHVLLFAVPAYAAREESLVSRWRVNYAGGLTYTGLADDGEVEDHIVQVVCHVPDVVDEPNLVARAMILANGLNIGTVTAECNDLIADGNVISTDPPYCTSPECGSIVDIVVSTGPCEEECFPSDHNDYAQWLKAGKPECWCDPNQCYGDADLLREVTKAGSWQVSSDDLNYLSDGWQRPDGQDGVVYTWEQWRCADFDHVEEATKAGTWRVSSEDLNILSWNWQDDNHINPPDPNYGPLNRSDCVTRGH